MTLARLLRAGELTSVWVPDEAQEALRDLTRAREDMKHLQRVAKQRLSAFLLRHGRPYPGKKNWSQAHFRWLETLKFDQPVQQIVFQEYIDTVQALTKRVADFDAQIEVVGTESAPSKQIEGYMALRGMDRLTAITLGPSNQRNHSSPTHRNRKFASGPDRSCHPGSFSQKH